MKKKIVSISIITIVIAVIAVLYAYVDRAVVLYDNETYTRSQLTTPMYVNADSEYNYEFHCEYDELSGFKMILSNTGSDEGTIEYTVYDTEGNQVAATRTKKISSFKSGKYTTLRIDKIEGSEGKDYVLNIKSTNSADDSALVMCEPDDTPVPGMLYLYRIWDLETMIVVALCLGFLVLFVNVLVKIFRK